MAALRCILARLTAQIPAPLFLSQTPSTLADVYRTASGNAIDLQVDTTHVVTPLEQHTRLHLSLDLHHRTRELTQNPRDGSRVGAVAVMYGGRYAHAEDVFGVMFDRGFSVDTPDDRERDPKIVGLPREGCAIFLDAIAASRQAGEQYERQVRFTTVHELGHLFNLLHLQSPLNYLSTSRSWTTYDEAFFKFESKHMKRLAVAEDDLHVWPGGSDFEDLGVDDEQYDTAFRKRSRQPANGQGLTLRISTARDRFRYCEPIELDISVRLSRKASASVRFPNTLDPGYGSFRLWIEEPNGERRLYRSPRRYCPQGSTRRLKPGEVFRRDVSLFGESGGHTFRRIGVHRVWVEWDINSRRTLRSNTLELDLESSARSSLSEEAACALATLEAAQILYYRLDRQNGKGVQLLEAMLAAQPSKPAAASIRYALARTYSAANVDAARHHFERAADAVTLGENQRNKALAWLSQNRRSGTRRRVARAAPA